MGTDPPPAFAEAGPPDVKAALGWTALAYLILGAVTLPMAAQPMPSHAVPCDALPADPAWAVWIFRDTVWLSLALTLPAAAILAATLVRRQRMPARTAAALGIGLGVLLTVALVAYAMATAGCEATIHQVTTGPRS